MEAKLMAFLAHCTVQRESDNPIYFVLGNPKSRASLRLPTYTSLEQKGPFAGLRLAQLALQLYELEITAARPFSSLWARTKAPAGLRQQ